jgi:predicted glycosyltransferase
VTAGSVMIWVQHLLGVGHLVRAAALARAFSAEGWQSHLVSGGRPWAGLDIGGAQLHQLPPLTAADASFSALMTEQGDPPPDVYLSERAAQLHAIFNQIGPDVLIIEHYPFGRRQMRFELTPLLSAAKGRCLIAASVRDILVTRRPDRHAEARDILRAAFDLILVHGDPAFISLDETFPDAAAVADLVRYTGFLGGTAPAPTEPNHEIIVSAGGGAVGTQLEQAALAAARQWTGSETWRLLIGANRPDATVRTIANDAPPNLQVESARPDFRQLLAGAAASVSQAGYNTVMDILAARPPAVLVPFASEQETEQTLRAERMAECGLAVHLPEADLSASTLADAIGTAMAMQQSDTTFPLDGAERSVALVAAHLASHNGIAP